MLNSMYNLLPGVSEVSKTKKDNIIKSFNEVEYSGGV